MYVITCQHLLGSEKSAKHFKIQQGKDPVRVSDSMFPLNCWFFSKFQNRLSTPLWTLFTVFNYRHCVFRRVQFWLLWFLCTRSLAVHEWNSSKSWITIWIFNSHEDWWKTHSCFSIFMRLFLLDFLCRPFQQFPHDCKEKSHISDWDFFCYPILIKLNEGFWKYLSGSIFSSLGKKKFQVLPPL